MIVSYYKKPGATYVLSYTINGIDEHNKHVSGIMELDSYEPLDIYMIVNMILFAYDEPNALVAGKLKNHESIELKLIYNYNGVFTRVIYKVPTKWYMYIFDELEFTSPTQLGSYLLPFDNGFRAELFKHLDQ